MAERFQDPAASRATALRLLDEVLDGRLTRVGDLRRAWPEAGPDFLLRRARQEAEHYLVTKGDLERRFVVLLRRFLEEGGTAAALEAAYDEVIRHHGAGGQCDSSVAPGST